MLARYRNKPMRGVYRVVQWHYIDKLSNDTVPNYTYITTNHQALFTVELKLRDDFRCFRTFSTVPLNSRIIILSTYLYLNRNRVVSREDLSSDEE